jgi:flavodoxin
MKKFLTALTAFLMTASLAGCAGQSAEEEKTPQPEETQEPSAAEETAPQTAEEKTLVAYFSCTGNTKKAAEMIAEITGADLYEIKAAQEYTSEDLNWHDSSTRATVEQNDPSVRPEIGSETLDLSGYKTVYVGYPIWWGEEPRIMDTFVESYDFADMTMIPFCTSSSSGMGRSGKNLAEKAGSGNWLEGSRFASGVSKADLEAWINSMK